MIFLAGALRFCQLQLSALPLAYNHNSHACQLTACVDSFFFAFFHFFSTNFLFTFGTLKAKTVTKPKNQPLHAFNFQCALHF